MLFALVFLTVFLGIYPSVVLDGLHYASSSLIYQTSSNVSLSLPIIIVQSSTLELYKSI